MPEYNAIIETLERLITENLDDQNNLGQALGLIRHCKKHRFTIQDKVTDLPINLMDTWGYFVVYECDEVGNLLGPVCDPKDNPIEIPGGAKVVE